MLDARSHHEPSWIIFKTGKHQTRIPFAETAPALAWRNILDITTLGFCAHRIGDAIVITGKPSNHPVEVWS